MKKKALGYSPLTEKVYYVDGKGETHDVHQSFLQMLLSFINGGKLPEVGDTSRKELTVNGNVQWELTCKRVSA